MWRIYVILLVLISKATSQPRFFTDGLHTSISPGRLQQLKAKFEAPFRAWLLKQKQGQRVEQKDGQDQRPPSLQQTLMRLFAPTQSDSNTRPPATSSEIPSTIDLSLLAPFIGQKVEKVEKLSPAIRGRQSSTKHTNMDPLRHPAPKRSHNLLDGFWGEGEPSGVQILGRIGIKGVLWV